MRTSNTVVVVENYEKPGAATDEGVRARMAQRMVQARGASQVSFVELGVSLAAWERRSLGSR